MAKIVIPRNQEAQKGQPIVIKIRTGFENHGQIKEQYTEVHLPCKSVQTSTAPYDEVFFSQDFNRNFHGFVGINDDLEKLCAILK